MVKHVLFNKLKDPTPENCQALIDRFLSMRGNVPCIVEVNAYADFLRSARSYDVILEVTLNSKEDLDVYSKDEYHCSYVKPYVHEVRESGIAIDYEF
ncbi:MAG: Dabb family protein [Clostridia bacterium]|nr:Dabb family protein [Clostridia bacterium]